MQSIKQYSSKFILLVALSGMLVTFKASAQQFSSYTQYMENLTPLNPAYSLLDKNGSVNTLVRKQWVGIYGAPSTYMLNAGVPLDKINGSAGIIVMNDNFTIDHLTEVNAYFAKAIQLTSKSYLGVSVLAGIRNYTSNYSMLDPTDPQFRNDVKQTQGNVGFGLMLYSDDYYLGLSVPELTVRDLSSPAASDNQYFRNRYNLSGAFIKTLSEDIKLKPATLVTYSRGVPVIADFSATLYLRDVFGIGADYRTNNEMAGIMSVYLDDVKLGYSYQFGTSANNISKFNNATHEITLAYRFGKNVKDHKIL